MNDQRFRLVGPGVVHETVDEETIIVNLDTGSYYDLNASGACIFEGLVLSASVAEIVTELEATYEVDPSNASADVQQLVAELVDEQLIVAFDDRQVSPGPTNGGGLTSRRSPSERRSYVAPALSKHTDMQELLLLDPVHEVDEAGWPRPA
jgi:hypothetical protein